MLEHSGLFLYSGSMAGAGRHSLWSRKRVEQAIGYMLVAPLLCWMLVVLIYPIFSLLALSFTNTRIIGAPSSFIAAENYVSTLQSAPFWASVGRSLTWLLGNIFLGTIVALAAALLLRQSWRLATQARVWILLPWVIPTVAVSVIWQWMLNTNYGVINIALQHLAIIDAPLNVFGSRQLAMVGVIVANTWHWFPLSAVVMFGAMHNIPAELYEAAQIDGANSWQQFRHITLPSIEKVLFALGLVGGLWTLNVFDTIYLITRGGPSDATQTLPVLIYDTAFKAQRIGQAAAMSVIAICLLAILATLYARIAAPKER